jgi:amino acid adenylation domain-containing protein
MKNIHVSEEVSIIANQSLKEKEYWWQNLSGELTRSSFPPDFKKITVNQMKNEKARFKLAGELYARLVKLSNHSDFKLHMILVAALDILLYQYTGERDIVVGTTIDRQNHQGEFINTILPLRNKLARHMTFKDLLLQVRETVYGAIEHQNYPLESLLNDLNMAYTGPEFPLFDIAILLENIHDKKYLQDARISLTFYFIRTDQTVEGFVEYDALLYEKSTLDRIITYFTRILQKTLLNVQLSLQDIELLTEQEKREILFDFNETEAVYPKNRRIQQLFEDQVEKSPQNTAAVDADDNCSISYKELNQRSNQLAKLLIDKGVKEDTIVSLLLDRSIEMIVGILGILKAGGAYLPLDPDSPGDRIKFMLKDSGTALILTGKNLVETSDYAGDVYELIRLDHLEIYRGDRENPVTTGGMKSLAYLIYTSGTTGNPKGVLLQHQGLVNYVCWAARTYVKEERLNFPLYTSSSFDLTVTSLFTPLVTGNAVVVYGTEENMFLIEKIVDECKVGVIKLTPSHLKLIRNKTIDGLSKCTIKRFIVGGEELDTRLAKDICANFDGNIEIYNEYGPTETVVGSMIYKFTPGTDTGITVPIGIPIDNTRIYLLDRNQKPIPLGAAGEIYISGVSVARGYLKKPRLTAEKFTANRFVKGERWYRTGDMARWLSGRRFTIQFLGRLDQQISIRGFRVEIGEIESQLLNHKDIKETVVTAAEAEGGDKYLCAYLVPCREINLMDIKQYLQMKLPGYMVPAYFVFLENIPLTSNGKVDRKALPDPHESINPGTEYVAPGNKLEEKLVEIWKKELDLEKIGIKDNFFNLGGDSIKSVGLVSLINEEFNIKLKVVDLYQNETVEKFAIKINEYERTTSDDELEDLAVEVEKLKNQFIEEIES